MEFARLTRARNIFGLVLTKKPVDAVYGT
jgi:hypothetical protein